MLRFDDLKTHFNSFRSKVAYYNKYLLRGFVLALVVGGTFALYCQQTGRLPVLYAKEQINPELRKTASVAPKPNTVPPAQDSDVIDPPATPEDKRHEAEAYKEIQAGNREGLQQTGEMPRIQAKSFFQYNPTSVYQIYVNEGHLTDIQLQPGEEIQYIGGGDTVRWVVDKAQSGTGANQQWHVYIKPLKSGLVTNFIITTDRRSYQLRARSGKKYNPIIGWTYPHDDRAAFLRQQEEKKKREEEQITPAVSPDKMYFGYEISEKSGWFSSGYSWTPKMVFDDGRKVYIQMAGTMPSGQAPALFVKDETGLALVNYRVKDNYYIVDRLFEMAELRNGMKEIVVITRKK